MPVQDPKDLRPPRKRGAGAWLVALVLLLAVAGFGWNWWQARQAPAAVPAALEQPAAVVQAPQPQEPQPIRSINCLGVSGGSAAKDASGPVPICASSSGAHAARQRQVNYLKMRVISIYFP